MSISKYIGFQCPKTVVIFAGIMQKHFSIRNLLPKAESNGTYSRRTLCLTFAQGRIRFFFSLSVKNGFVSEFINFSLIWDSFFFFFEKLFNGSIFHIC